MYKDKGIDWYQISKLNNSNFNLEKFNQLIGNVEMGYGIDRVTTNHRQKILILFQNASKIIRTDKPNLMAENNQLQIKRNIVADKLNILESQVEGSFKEISNLKFILAEKKRLLLKLRAIVAKKNKQSDKKIYYCSFCEREDFITMEELKAHISNIHKNDKGNQNLSQTANQVHDLKDLIMTMKDKQIQMMSMFLRASRQMQTQKLQKDYQTQYKKVMQISGTKTDQSKEQGQMEELKGESQFLFFQKSQPFRREMQRDQQFKRKLAKQKQTHNLQKQFYQGNNYYNVFGTIEENVSNHIEEGRKQTKQNQQSVDYSKSHAYYDPNEFLNKFLKNQSISKESRISLVDNTPKPYLQFKQAKLIEKDSVFLAPSISDRLRLMNQKQTNNKYQTMFSTKRKFYDDNDYIFNSGPLMEDKGGDSDYEDYFGANQNQSRQIEDEEIKINMLNSNKSFLPNMNRESFHLSKLLSPKEQSNQSLYQKSQKQKSSVIVDLSDSFSKRDFEISKDDETINLSDLKLSKLQRKKQEEKQTHKGKQSESSQQKKSIVSDSNVDSKHYSSKTYGVEQISKVSKDSHFISNFKKDNDAIGDKKGRSDVLRQFERPKMAPLKQQNYKFQEIDYSQNTSNKSNQRVNIIQATFDQNIMRKSKTNNLGILNQFFRSDAKPETIQMMNRQGTGQLDKFIK